MRWTKNDSLAFDATMKAGQMIRDAYDNYQAGEAYKAGAGLGASTPEEYRRYADTYAESNPEAAAAFRQAAEANYTAPTAQERRRQGIGAQADWYAGRGDIAKSNALYDQADQMELRGMQLNKIRQDEDLRKQQMDILKGAEEARAALAKGDYTKFKEFAETQYNGQLPGLDDGKTIRFLDDGVIAVTDKNGFGQTRMLNPELAQQMLDHGVSRRLAAISPENWQQERTFQRGLSKDKDEANYRKGVLAYHEKDIAEKSRHNKEAEAIARARAGESGGQPKIATINVPDPNNPSKTIKQTIQVVRDGKSFRGLTLGGTPIPQEIFERGMQDGEAGSGPTDQGSFDYRTRRANILAYKPNELTWEGKSSDGKPLMLSGEAARTKLLEDLDKGEAARVTLSNARREFESIAKHDRNSAVLQAVRDADSQLKTPQAREQYLTQLGVSTEEAAAVRKLLSQNNARVGIGRSRSSGGAPAELDAYSRAAQDSNASYARDFGLGMDYLTDAITPDVYKYGQPGRRLYTGD